MCYSLWCREKRTWALRLKTISIHSEKLCNYLLKIGPKGEFVPTLHRRSQSYVRTAVYKVLT